MKFKKSLPILAILLVIAAGVVSQAANAQSPSKRRPRIAVLDFDYATVQSYSSALFGTNVDIGKGITDLLVTGLVKDGTYSIIERKALDKIMAEQNFSNSNRADPTSAARIGKLLGVDAIIEGSITQFGNETKKTNLGGGGGGWGGFGLGGVGHSNSKANVSITARLINIDTGEIMGVAEGAGQSSRSSTSLLGGGGNWHGWGGGDAPKVAVRTITVDGLVAAVDGGQIVLNVGRRAGVNAGDQLEVVRVTKVIKDPSTGAVIRKLTSLIGVVKATDVDDSSAVCSVVSGVGFQTGDAVRSVTQ